MSRSFHPLRRTGTIMAAIGAAGLLLLVGVSVIRLVRGVWEPGLLMWVLVAAMWFGLTAVAMTHTFTRGTDTTTISTLGKTIRTIHDDQVSSVRMNGRRFEVSAGGREVCSVLTGHGVGLESVLELYRPLILSRPQLVDADQALRRWAWQQAQL